MFELVACNFASIHFVAIVLEEFLSLKSLQCPYYNSKLGIKYDTFSRPSKGPLKLRKSMKSNRTGYSGITFSGKVLALPKNSKSPQLAYNSQ